MLFAELAAFIFCFVESHCFGVVPPAPGFRAFYRSNCNVHTKGAVS